MSRNVSNGGFRRMYEEADFDRQLWVSLPKEKKTLGGNDWSYLQKAGLSMWDKPESGRVSNFILLPTALAKTDVGIYGFESRGMDALNDLADPFACMDAAIVGRDILTEFNLAAKAEGRTPLEEALDLDIMPCTLSIAVKDQNGSSLSRIQDLNGAVFASKYYYTTLDWAKRNNIRFKRLIKRTGGMEDAPLVYPGMAGFSDIIDTGKSLRDNGFKPLGIREEDWKLVCDGKKYNTLPDEVLNNLPGTIMRSNAVLVFSPYMKAFKKAAAADLIVRLENASLLSGQTPKIPATAASILRAA